MKDEAGVSLLDAELARRVRARPPAGVQLDFGLSNEPGAVTLAFALDWENVAVEKVDDVYKVVIDLHAQVLAFDFAEKKIIAAFPVAIQLRDAAPHPPDDAYILERVRKLYLNDDYGLNIFEAFVKRLEVATINAKYSNYLQLVSVDVTERATAALGQANVDVEVFKGFVGQHFTKFLSTNQNVGILPYSKGQAIGGKMPARFADGKVFNFVIPEPDYQMKIDYTGFAKKQLDKNEVWEAWLYVTGFRLAVQEPLSGRVYLDADFRDSVVKKLVAGGEADDWTAYQEAFFTLSNNLTQQISERSSDWLDKRTKTVGVADQLKTLQEVVERCR